MGITASKDGWMVAKSGVMPRVLEGSVGERVLQKESKSKEAY